MRSPAYTSTLQVFSRLYRAVLVLENFPGYIQALLVTVRNGSPVFRSLYRLCLVQLFVSVSVVGVLFFFVEPATKPNVRFQI